MNERIIELRKDAYKLVQTDLQTNERDEVVDNREHLKMVFDKFAELLIRECARVDSEQNNPDHIDGETYNQTILYHFGVK